LPSLDTRKPPYIPYLFLAFSAMFNGYYDFHLDKFGAEGAITKLTPFIGAGIGAAVIGADAKIAGARIVDDSDTVFAFQAIAGLYPESRRDPDLCLLHHLGSEVRGRVGRRIRGGIRQPQCDGGTQVQLLRLPAGCSGEEIPRCGPTRCVGLPRGWPVSYGLIKPNLGSVFYQIFTKKDISHKCIARG
jgi:hypothetical protein